MKRIYAILVVVLSAFCIVGTGAGVCGRASCKCPGNTGDGNSGGSRKPGWRKSRRCKRYSIRTHRRLLRVAYNYVGRCTCHNTIAVIVYSEISGWHFFMSSRLEENEGSYEGLTIAPAGSRYEGKLVEYDAEGNEVRPWDFSITKVSFCFAYQ